MPPSTNQTHRSIDSGVIKSRAYREYEEQVGLWRLMHSAAVIPAIDWLRHSIAADHTLRLTFRARFYFDRKRILCLNGAVKANDTSNRIKPLHDVVANLLLINDKYFWAGDFDKGETPIGVQEHVAIEICAYNWNPFDTARISPTP